MNVIVNVTVNCQLSISQHYIFIIFHTNLQHAYLSYMKCHWTSIMITICAKVLFHGGGCPSSKKGLYFHFNEAYLAYLLFALIFRIGLAVL